MDKLKITSENLDTFKELLKSISHTIKECYFKFSENGVSMATQDNAVVAMCLLNLNKSFFHEESSFDKCGKYGFNIDRMKKAINRFRDGVVEIEFGDIIKLKDSSKEIPIPVLVEDVRQNKIPVLEDGLMFKLDTKLMTGALEDVAAVTKDDTSMSLFIEGDKLICQTETEENYPIITKITPNEIVKNLDGTKSSYSTRYLSNLLIPEFTVLINLKTDYPLRMSYSGDGWEMTYILAPRIENRN